MRQAEPYLQTLQDWRGAGHFMFGGTGAGLIVFTTLGHWFDMETAHILLAGVALMALGLGLVWPETGRRLRAMNVLRYRHMSWVTRESLAAVLTFVFGLAAASTGDTWLFSLTALFAATFLYCQARILKSSKEIPVWREGRLTPFIGLTGLTEGLAVYILIGSLAGLAGFTNARPFLIFVIDVLVFFLPLVIFARGVSWAIYHAHVKNSAPPAAVQVLARLNTRFQLFGNGVAGFLAFMVWLLIGYASQFELGGSAFVIILAIILTACLAALLGGWYAKFVIIARAS